MGLFTSRKKNESLKVTPQGDRMHRLGAVAPVLTAREAFSAILPYVTALGTPRRLYLVLSGEDLDMTGRAAEWGFHFIFPNDQREAIFTVIGGERSPQQDSAVVIEKITTWPPAGSTQEAMLQFQGPAARLIVEQQWADRVERLPGLPEGFVDSDHAMITLQQTGADLHLGGGVVKLKGRTPPGAYPVWEVVTGFEVLHTPFLDR